MSSEEIKEILEKQLTLLSEASKKTEFPSDLSLLTGAMISIVNALALNRLG